MSKVGEGFQGSGPLSGEAGSGGGRPTLWQEFRQLLDLSQARRDTIRAEVEEGAFPNIRYYIFIGIASLVAALGLVTNSPAVIIGAMLISPLMTPMFGVSLGLVSGRTKLARTALVTLFSGVFIAMACGFLVGLLPLQFKVTPEMLARTQPTLLDLCVAILAGGAGCLAMLDERISPVLTGIAIATSLVPPLADSGLCLALGAPSGALGAFLLFFANQLAIIIVSSILFALAGLAHRSDMGSGLALARRFLFVIVGTAVVTVLLTSSLFRMVDNIRIQDAIERTVLAEIADRPATTLDHILFKKNAGKTDVLVSLRSAKALSPENVKALEEKTAAALGTAATVIVRSEIVEDVSATGSTSVVVDENLDGKFIANELDPDVRRLQTAEQTAREIIDELPGVFLRDLDLIELDGVPVVLASIEGTRPVSGPEVGEAEALLQERLRDPHVRLVVRAQDLIGVTRKGRILYGSAHLAEKGAEEQALQDRIEAGIRDRVKALSEIFPLNVDAYKDGELWHARAQVVGARMIKPAEIADIENQTSADAGVKLDLNIWCSTELVVDHAGYAPREGYSESAAKE
jgi:uncharacterized hydrophobic protein (TIGR00271 family)